MSSKSTTPMTGNSPMPFGKHKGKALANVPDSYLLWLYEENVAKGALLTYLTENIDVIRHNAQQKSGKR